MSGSVSEEEVDEKGEVDAEKAVNAVKPDVQPSEEKQGVKAGDDLKQITSVTKGSVHCAATLLGMDLLQKLCRVIVSVIQPIRQEHGSNAAMCRDEHGT